MEKAWNGENFRQNNSGAHLEDEQASSDEEGFPLEQNGHPLVTTRDSMYSRIQQEVSLRLPSIDFNAVEVDDEAGDVVIARYWPPDNIHGVLDMPDFVEGNDGDVDSNASRGFVQYNFRQANSAGSDEECSLDQATNHRTSSQYACQNCMGEGNARDRKDNLQSAPACRDFIGSHEKLDDRNLESKSIIDTTKNDAFGEVGMLDKNMSLFEDFGLGDIKLETDIDEKNLDAVLGTGPGLFDLGCHSKIGNSTSDVSTDDDDSDALLLAKLSSFAVTEKNSVCETNLLLKQLLTTEGAALETKASQSVRADNYTDNSRLSNVKKDSAEVERKTVYIDLRSTEKSSLVKICDERSAPTKEESSSSSEGEDWMKIRSDVKAGLNAKHFRKREKLSENRTVESKLHDRMTRRSYEKFASHEAASETEYRNSSREYSSLGHKTKKIEGEGIFRNAAFDIDPLDEKIRSWHQIGNQNQNEIFSVLNDIHCSDRNMIYRTDANDSCIETKLYTTEQSVRTIDSVREIGTSTEFAFEEVRRGSSKDLEAESEESSENTKKAVKDSSLLRLEDVPLKSENFRNARTSLLIVDESKPLVKESYNETAVHCANQSEKIDLMNGDSKIQNVRSYIVNEPADHVRISANLMLIKANISEDLQDTQGGPVPSEAVSSYGERVLCERQKQDATGDAETVGNGLTLPNHEDREYDVAFGDNQISEQSTGGLLPSEEIGKSKLTEQQSKERCSAAAELVCETEMKTFSMVENEKCDFVSGGEEMVELSSTMKGLLPQYGWQMSRNHLNSGLKGMQKHFGVASTGNEVAMTKRQGGCVTSSADPHGVQERKHTKPVMKSEEEASQKKAVDTKDGECALLERERKMEDDENGNGRIGSSKNKKKSKKKNRKSVDNVDDNEVLEGKSIDRKKMKNELHVKATKNAGNVEKDVKKKVVCLVKESERIRIEEKMKSLQQHFGLSNVIFDEKVSYTEACKSLPSSKKDGAKLLLKVLLQSPGVCSKSCAKNTLAFNQRSDAYIGLCTLFLSLLRGSKIKVCDALRIPFDVIALKQASIDSELQLLVGIIENEVQIEPTQQTKRGKLSKGKKNFYQTVTQYLNKTDLEKVLLDLMKFDYTQKDVSTVSCPGSKKLSSYVTVSQDEAAVARIFNLKPSLIWGRSDETDPHVCDDMCWMKGKKKRNETTCVMIENITSMLPRTLVTLLRTARNNSWDICGLRVAYITKTEKDEEPALVTAFRGPNVTTANAGTLFTNEARQLGGVKSIYMPHSFDSCCDEVKEVTVTGPSSVVPFTAMVSEPLISYTIGRGRGELEVVNWFGRRTLTLADTDVISDDVQKATTKSSSLPDKLDVLSRHSACASLLVSSTNRIVLSLSHLVPTVFISIAISEGESRGLHALSAGKILLGEEELLLLGLKVDDVGENGVGGKPRNGKCSQSISVILFEGENPMYRAYGLLRSLFDKMNCKLPRDALTKDAMVQRLNENCPYEQMKQDRSIEEFFGIIQISRKVINILEKMTAQNLSHLDIEVMNALPPNWKLYMLPETPRICTAIFVGEPMVEIFPYILKLVLGECLEDPFCINTKASTERKYLQQERSVAEIIGFKCFRNLSKHIAHVCCPYVVGAKHWASSVENLRNGPVIVLVLRLLDTIAIMEEKCRRICRDIQKHLRSNELNCSADSFYDAFTYTHLDTVFRILLNMFKVDELMPDACPTWFKSTQWPVYLSCKSAIVKRIDPILGLFTNTHQLQPFRACAEAPDVNSSDVKILSPLEMNIPAELILGKQVSFSCMEITIDNNFSKHIPKILGRLRRDLFEVVGLSFPSDLSPSVVKSSTLHVALRRPDAVYRLNQWLPELKNELHESHNIKVSKGAWEAYDVIARNFQKTQSGGIFDDSNLSVMERLTFKNDDVYDCRSYRRVRWLANNFDSVQDVRPDSNRGYVLPEVNVLILTNVMMRGTYLSEYISENAKVLGFWEHLSSLGFKTIGARMTSLKQEQVDSLLEKLKLPTKDHQRMEKRIPASNGPIFVLVVLRDFALSNFWNIATKKLTEEECKIISENVLIPTSKIQVEVLASSLFETVAMNSEMEIEKIGALKECHVCH